MSKSHIEDKTVKYVNSQLRRLFRYSSAYKECKARCKVDKELYRCEGCKVLINKNGKDDRVEYEGEVAVPEKMYVDHIEPFVPLEGWDSNLIWARLAIERMFLSPEGLQYLCHSCHKKKTNEENRIRRLYREQRKKNL